MTPSRRQHISEFGAPKHYRFVVRGLLSPGDCDRIRGLRITSTEGDSDPPTTTLLGRLEDQAHLSGVLSALYEMHMTIVSVQAVTPPETNDENA